MLADLAKLSVRQFLFAPLSAALSGVFGGGAPSAASRPGCVHRRGDLCHAGGMVGAGPHRIVPARAFLRAPRLHAGGGFGLAADEYAAILQRGERVLNRRRDRGLRAGAAGGAPNVTITPATPRASGNRARRSPSDIARAVAFGRRGHLTMAFHEVRFPDNISRGARGGPERRTQVVELAYGDEERNAPGPTRAAATTPPMASAAPTISPRSSPSSRRGTAACTASAGRTGATTRSSLPIGSR